MPGVAQSVSMNVWYAISQIPDKELRGLAERIFRLYDRNKSSEFGGILVWLVVTMPVVVPLAHVPLVPWAFNSLAALIALAGIWSAWKYVRWRRRLSDEEFARIIYSEPRGQEAAELVYRLYHDNHPFG
jgi:hypothetical protein